MSEQSLSFILAPERGYNITIHATHGGKRYRMTHRLRAPQLEDWREFEKALQVEVEEKITKEELQHENTNRLTHARLLLWGRLLESAEGYACPAGGGDGDKATAAKDVPPGHAVTAVTPLAEVYDWPAEEEGEAVGFPLMGTSEVVLQSPLSPGVRLVHRFRPPTAEEYADYREKMSRTRVTTGLRSGTYKTRYPLKLEYQVKLYDELFLDAEGYTLDGQTVTERETFVRAMDPWHKRIAVNLLMNQEAETE